MIKKDARVFVTSSTEETFDLAKKIAKKLKARDVVALTGELGSGKTHFVKGLADGIGVDKNIYVRSPSFIIINEYLGKLKLFHFDFYRLESLSELNELGIEEYLDGTGVSVIEWADRLPAGFLPKRTIHIHFEIVDETTRKIRVTSKNPHFLSFPRKRESITH